MQLKHKNITFRLIEMSRKKTELHTKNGKARLFLKTELNKVKLKTTDAFSLLVYTLKSKKQADG